MDNGQESDPDRVPIRIRGDRRAPSALTASRWSQLLPALSAVISTPSWAAMGRSKSDTKPAYTLAALLLVVTVPIPAAVQPVSAPVAQEKTQEEKKGTQLILLGTGGGPKIYAERSRPASLLVVDGRPYLIDCGSGTVEQLKRAGFEPIDVTRLFLTHLHMDHTAGLASLIGSNWVSGEGRPMEIYGPPGTTALTTAAVDFLAIPESLHASQFPPYPAMRELVRPRDVDPDAGTVVYQDDRLRVTAVENTHYETMNMPMPAYGRPRSYSYRFDTADRGIVITGDTGPSAAVAKLAKHADTLVSEVIDIEGITALIEGRFDFPEAQLKPLIAHMVQEHLTPAEVGRLASEANVKLVVLSHIGPGADGERDALRYSRGVREHFKGPVVVGRDLDQF